MHGVRLLPTNSTTITSGRSVLAAVAMLSSQSHSAVPPKPRSCVVLRTYGALASRRLSPYMITPPCGGGGGGLIGSQAASAPRTPSAARTPRTRFILPVLPFVPLERPKRYSVLWKL